MSAGDGLPPPDETPPGSADDRYYQGRILRLYPGSQSGVVRSNHGRDIAFAVRDVRILGTTRGFPALAEGMRVGFDLGRTSRGLRVTAIKVYDDGGPSQSGSDVR